MKKLLLILVMFAGTFVHAQTSNVESAVIYLRNSEIEDAKKAIDAAAVNADTKDDPKMWSVRAAVYDSIYRNPELKQLDNNTEEKFVTACLKCLQTDVKKRYKDYCEFAVINSAFAAYNKGIQYYQANDPANALKFFGYVIAVFPYDKNEDLKKNNINEKQITLSMADMALKSKNYIDAKKNLQKLIDLDYNDPIIYRLMANINFTEGDTAKGLSYTELGRKRFANDKDLMNQELNIYLTQGREDVLLNKLNEALAADEENATLLFVRGNVYDNSASAYQEQAKHKRDTAATLNKKAKVDKVPTNKLKLENSAKIFSREADSLYRLQAANITKAETDYQAVVRINPEYLDGYFNLGALNNNKTTEVVGKMNALSPGLPDYDKKWGAYKKIQDSILMVSVGYFNKAVELADALPDTDEDKKAFKDETLLNLYKSLQLVYANMGNEKKTMEMIAKQKELKAAH